MSSFKMAFGVFMMCAAVHPVTAKPELKEDWKETLSGIFSPPPMQGLPDAYRYHDYDEAAGHRLKEGTHGKAAGKSSPSYYDLKNTWAGNDVPVFKWASVKGWEKCGGRGQSPIAIDIAAAKSNRITLNIASNFKTVQTGIANNKHNVGAIFSEDPGRLTVSGAKDTSNNGDYNLKQFHFHSPSEHVFVKDGVNVYTPLEMHMVHTNAGGKYAVVSIMFEVDDEKAKALGGYKFLQQIEGAVQNMTNGHAKVDAGDVDFSELAIDTSDFFYYVGSLTTPPCTEGVNWFVLADTRYITTAFHKMFVKGIDIPGGNNRVLNPLNGRVVSWGVATK